LASSVHSNLPIEKTKNLQSNFQEKVNGQALEMPAYIH
jgi:hypothetical protein